MKAVIFNSGLGNRMGDFTQSNHKSMARLKNGETIFHRQIRLLSQAGIREFIVTTGPFEDQLISEIIDFPELDFTFVRNDIYYKTNYIYSMYLAREHMNDDLVFLHGDLVFSYFEYVGEDYEADMAKMAEDPVTQDWWTHTHPCFETYAIDPTSEFYHDMKQIFFHP